ncbi:SHOCT domain-containing protein [Segetibacter koreensis]|uniref:SHOCT domain-containing protein n=1 Tax=Segetibacter koreensis TaxID=398037 RepID=UPI00036AAB3E|nr:SHOCT domain-containing protein [Segetibacter koreensis]
MWHRSNGMFWGMHFLWWLFLLLIVAVFFVFRNNIIQRTSDKESPLDILKKRFARGEINKEEYEERRRVLEQG